MRQQTKWTVGSIVGALIVLIFVSLLHAMVPGSQANTALSCTYQNQPTNTRLTNTQLLDILLAIRERTAERLKTWSSQNQIQLIVTEAVLKEKLGITTNTPGKTEQ